MPDRPDVGSRLLAAIDEASPGARIERYASATATAQAAAASAGCDISQIVKSLLFIADGRPVLAVVAGDRRVDTGRLAPLLGLPRKRIRMANPDEVQLHTGYAVGAVPPFGHPAPLETIVDASLARTDPLHAAGGAEDALFTIAYADLLAAAGGRAAEITV
jgi:prolyl-tRNA editing enzyme YbaK/EbsC (Cys-tRNA(Pro) deacylase)